MPCVIFKNVPAALRTLDEINALDPQALRALVLAQQSELSSQQTEIDNLKLLVFKLKRMQFGRSSEKLDRQVQQLELRLEDLEMNEAASEPEPIEAASAASAAPTQKQRRKPARRPLPASLPRETVTQAPQQEACPSCGGNLRPLGEDVSETLEYVPAHFKVIRTVRPQTELLVLRKDRTGTGTEPANRSGSGGTGTSGACAGG